MAQIGAPGKGAAAKFSPNLFQAPSRLFKGLQAKQTYF
jgi:hypothetical protein